MKRVPWLEVVLVAALTTCSVRTSRGAGGKKKNWIERDRIRAGWIYYGDGVDKIAFFKKLGMNAMITHARQTETFYKWAEESKRQGMHLFGVFGYSFDAKKAGMRCAVFGNGYQGVVPCPCSERFWKEQLTTEALKLVRAGMTQEREISGILIDFELYHNRVRGGQGYYTDACYCDDCWAAFLKHKGEDRQVRELAFGERKPWILKNRMATEYQAFHQQRVRVLAAHMRKKVKELRKDFFLGFYPRPHNWMLKGVAQGLGTRADPMILWSTATYGGGGPSKIPDDWKARFEQEEIFTYYSAGMLLRLYSSENLVANTFGCAEKGNGYWYFSMHPLSMPEDMHKGDYHLASGTREDYYREIKKANAELDRLCADPSYGPKMTLVPEPIRYRHIGYDAGRLKKIPKVVEGSACPRGQEMAVPRLALIESHFIVTVLSKGEQAALKFKTGKTKSNTWGVAYGVVGPDGRLAKQGRLEPGKTQVVRFEAETAGTHGIALTGGHYGRTQVVSTTVPFAFWATDDLEISRPGGTVHFYVPRQLESFWIYVKCNFATQMVQLTVKRPDGEVVKVDTTHPLERKVSLTIPTGGQQGQWSLTVERVGKRSDRSVFVRFDPRLSHFVTVSPEFIFKEAKKAK